MDNFHRPFSAQNISEFWKRWHISLSSWCRDYIFLPTLASTRNVALALLFSLGLLAMWHETNINYVLWGSAHVLATLIYRWWSCSNGHTWFRKLHPSTKYFGHIITFHFVAWSFTLVRGSGMDAIVEFWHPVIQSLTS